MKNEETELDLMNKRIFDLHNSGESTRSIAKAVGISKTRVHNVVTEFLGKGEVLPPRKLTDVVIEGTEQRFTSFVGYTRLNVDEYVHESTGDVIRITYVKANKPDEFGYFVKLNKFK